MQIFPRPHFALSLLCAFGLGMVCGSFVSSGTLFASLQNTPLNGSALHVMVDTNQPPSTSTGSQALSGTGVRKQYKSEYVDVLEALETLERSAATTQ